MILRPLAPPWLVVLAALVLLAVVAWLVVRRPGERRWWLLRGLMVLLATAIVLRPGVGSSPPRHAPPTSRCWSSSTAR